MELTAAQCKFIYDTAMIMVKDKEYTELNIRRFFLNYFLEGSFSDEQISNLTKALKERFHPNE